MNFQDISKPTSASAGNTDITSGLSHSSGTRHHPHHLQLPPLSLSQAKQSPSIQQALVVDTSSSGLGIPGSSGGAFGRSAGTAETEHPSSAFMLSSPISLGCSSFLPLRRSFAGPGITSELAANLNQGSNKRVVPTVFRWNGGGDEIYLSGTFNGWEKEIMVKR
ncbi:unnamed protein product [Protopolystoma xenopodis]|uniref:AMP-activated protein kinase glycogen-binding domain-containing protein n=1 Tax=Protopolystoma xenopodis TaxID=117903 RepID=A0A3S5AKJ5_9PLAT|nr:unnamed protein product [Protopolystoma xenopodis]